MKEKDPIRNKPSKEGRHNDPGLRDESALQSGVNTISSSTDDANKDLTETAADDFRTDNTHDGNADPAFDEIEEDD